MNQLYELALYVLTEDGDPDMLDVMITASREECLQTADRYHEKLGPRQYFELFNDDTQETIYVIKDGRHLTSYKALVKALG